MNLESQWKTVLMDREEKKKGKTSEELVAKDTEATSAVCEEVVAEDHITEKKEKTKKGKVRTMKKVTEKVTIQNTLNMLQEQLEPFSVHNNTNIMQLASF